MNWTELQYKRALGMALNIDPDDIVDAKIDYDLDLWTVGVSEPDGITYIGLTGKYVRACYKWLLKHDHTDWFDQQEIQDETNDGRVYEKCDKGMRQAQC